MLLYLQAKNIALIEKVELEFNEKLNIFTGETGAGKSMLIDSIQFAIGNRTSKQIIRKGQDAASVSLLFYDEKGMGISYLEDLDISCEDGNILIERVLYQSGRTLYKINGHTATRQMVKELAAFLIDVHGQHEPQSLLDVSKHIGMLDSFGDETFFKQKQTYGACYHRWQQLKIKVQQLGEEHQKNVQLKDLLAFQYKEIEEAHLKEGEEEELKEQYEMLSHAERIMTQCQMAYDYLDGGSEREQSAILLIGKAIQAVGDISTITEDIHGLYQQLLSVEAELQDITYEIRKYTDQIEYSPEVLIEVQNRLDVIYKLKQKYGNSIIDILDYKEKCKNDLENLSTCEENKERLYKEIKAAELELEQLGQKISARRKEMAKALETAVDSHLHDLQMPHAKFEVAINDLDTFNKNGKNDVEFLIRTNLGEDIHPLSKIASGGEISRVMLAIKTVMVLGDTIDTVIFDEIDTGISGIAAQKVAEKLAAISRMRQVICITHLPQIAAMSDSHYLIEKEIIGETTKTKLIPLNHSLIVEELCRLMGGLVTKSTLQGAKDIRKSAIHYKENISV